MLVTVAVSVYNAAPFIEDCIKMIRSQTYGNIEILFVVDSKTTDNTLEILKRPEFHDVRVVIQNDDGRLGGARNLSMDNANGDFIWFLDADDCYVPTLIEEVIGIMEENKSDVVAFNYYYTSTPGLKYPDDKKYEVRFFSGPQACNLVSEGKIPIQTWSKIFRTPFLKKNNLRFSSKQYSEDYDHTVSSFMCAESVAYYTKPVYTYYLNDKSCSVGAGDKIFRRDVEITGELLEKMQSNCPDNYGVFCSMAAKHILRSMTNVSKSCFKEMKSNDIIRRCIDDGTENRCAEISLFRFSPILFYYAGKYARRLKFSKSDFTFSK